MLDKWCPILAGMEPMRRELYETDTDASPALLETERRIRERLECMKERCAWFENGCPAYPKDHVLADAAFKKGQENEGASILTFIEQYIGNDGNIESDEYKKEGIIKLEWRPFVAVLDNLWRQSGHGREAEAPGD